MQSGSNDQDLATRQNKSRFRVHRLPLNLTASAQFIETAPAVNCCPTIPPVNVESINDNDFNVDYVTFSTFSILDFGKATDCAGLASKPAAILFRLATLFTTQERLERPRLCE